MRTTLPILLALLVTAVPARAITLTIESTLDVWNHFDPDYPPPYGPYNWLTGYEHVALGDPFALRVTFDESLAVVPGSTDPATFTGLIQTFEFMLGGEPMITFTNLNLTLRNGYNGVDSFEITSPSVSVPTVVGLKDWGPRGSALLVLTDTSNLALQAGEPIDFARFFDAPSDHFLGGVHFETGSPYGGYGPSIGARSSGPAALASPAAIPAVADAGAIPLLVLLGLLSFLHLRASRVRGV